MKSRITIEVDFDNGNLPVIQILSRNSDDVRDNLLKSFLQSLEHTSRWGKIEYKGNASPFAPPQDMEDPIHRWQVIPIKPEDLREEMKLMDAVIQEKIGIPSAPLKKEGSRPRNREDLMSIAEKAITDAMREVEGVGASAKLTEATLLLWAARDLVYDHLELK